MQSMLKCIPLSAPTGRNGFWLPASLLQGWVLSVEQSMPGLALFEMPLIPAATTNLSQNCLLLQGWVFFVEQSMPELIPHVSSCKSPQMMMGAVLKAYFS
jgi:hypothetical protein